jgi:membrane protease YdiL (CAAX protease family)
MIGAAAERRDASLRALLLLGGAAVATPLRVAAGGGAPSTSLGSAVLFGFVLSALAAAAGWRLRRERHLPRTVVAGTAGGLVLLATWLSSGAHLTLGAGDHLGPLLLWTPVVLVVAAAEEVLLRGALFAALLESGGATVALVLTAVVFALMHVPLYGWGALALDTAVGLFLGGLRLATGGATVPAIAHVVADLAAGWLG